MTWQYDSATTTVQIKEMHIARSRASKAAIYAWLFAIHVREGGGDVTEEVEN